MSPCKFASMMVALLLAGCGGAVENTEVADSNQSIQENNGARLNGIVLNGNRLNGSKLNGARLNGIVLNGTHLNGSHLNGTKPDGTTVDGFGFLNALLTGTKDDGSTVTLRIDAITQGVDPDLLFHRVSWQYGTTWQPLCGVDSSNHPILAIPLQGRWDEREGVAGGGSFINDTASFTFACRNGALAKCTEWGYKPWKSVNGVSLRNYHQTCTRVVRADYCGDGRSYTVNGNIIDIFDRMNIQRRENSGFAAYDGSGDRVGDWAYNAEWDDKGALCIGAALSRPGMPSPASCWASPSVANGRVLRNSSYSCDQNATSFQSGVLFKNWYVRAAY